MSAILVVDDDPISTELVRRTLCDKGYEVIATDSGARAIEIVRNEGIRLVITDWEMPTMSGVELCHTLRGMIDRPYTYIIMLTSRSGSRAVVDGLGAGADDFITKPFNPAELEMRVRVGRRVLSVESCHIAIFSLAKLAESRDPETGAHLERVRNYARELAGWLMKSEPFKGVVDASYVQLIYEAAPLHDIGKVAIPDCILLKPGQLTDREFQVMKRHTIEGARTLDAALNRYPDAAFLRIARDIARSHHERWDGAGYPDGLAGEDIPLCARIVAVADVYDALVSRRVYKGAYSHEIARGIILQEAGAHFDHRLVQAFLSVEDRFRSILEDLGDGPAHQTGNDHDRRVA